MQLSLSPEVQKQIDERVKSGQYRSAEDVVTAAILSLQQQESYGDFAPGELDTLIAEGEKDIAAGRVMGLEETFEELKRRHNLRQGRIS